jgi:polyhydroxybutyrate depolymerase
MSQLLSKSLMLNVLILILLITSCGLYAQGAGSLKTIEIGNDQRKYRLFIPSTYSADNAFPLILNFHGTNSHPDPQVELSEFETLAETEHFIVVSPLALFKRKIDGPITWNVNLKKGPDDVVFIRQLITKLKQQLSIDETQIFATGFSGGARMSSRLACDLSLTIAAIAPVAGIRYPDDCRPSRGVPTITFHGEKDMVNHYTLRSDSPVYWKMGVADAIAAWVKNNQCQSITQSQYSQSVESIQYKNCKNNADIDFYRSTEAGHTWPGSPMAEKLSGYGLGKTEQDLPASRLIWEFFKLHPLPKELTKESQP